MDRPIPIAIVFLLYGTFALAEQEAWRAAMLQADELRIAGRFTEAERMYRAALEEGRRLDPDGAPAATAYNNLVSLYQDMGTAAGQRGGEESPAVWLHGLLLPPFSV